MSTTTEVFMKVVRLVLALFLVCLMGCRSIYVNCDINQKDTLMDTTRVAPRR